MNELQGALPFIKQQPDKAVLGDASESTFAFYMSAGDTGRAVGRCGTRCVQGRAAVSVSGMQLAHGWDRKKPKPCELAGAA